MFVAVVGVAEKRARRLAPGIGLGVAVYGRLVRHRGTVLAAGLAFFALFALVPSLVSLGVVVALLFDPAAFAAQVEKLLADRPDILANVEPFLDEIASVGHASLASIGLTGLITLGLSLYAASKYIYVGRQVLDIAFEVEPRIPSLISRAFAMLIVLVAQVAIAAAVIATTVLPRILDALGVGDSYTDAIRLFRVPVAAIVVYLLLTASMRFGIQARRAVGWLNVGATFGTAVILLGTAGLGWYLSFSDTYSQAIAVLGGVIALEVWLYVVSLAMVGAAEIEGVRLGFRRRDLAVVEASEPEPART